MGKHWIDSEIGYLKEHYGEMTARAMADVLGKSKDAVERKIERLTRDDEIIGPTRIEASKLPWDEYPEVPWQLRISGRNQKFGIARGE